MISAQFTFTLYLVVFATERLGQSVVAAGLLLALAPGVAVAARIGWGVVSDRAFGGDRRPAMAIIAVLAGASSIGFSFLHLGVPLWIVTVGVVVLGASAIGWNGLYVTAVSEVAGQASAGTALGVSLAVLQLGVLIVPPLFGCWWTAPARTSRPGSPWACSSSSLPCPSTRWPAMPKASASELLSFFHVY